MGFFGASGGIINGVGSSLLGSNGKPVFEFNPERNTFSDLAGTVEANVGDSVANISNSDGTTSFIQDTASERPELQLKRSKRALYFDGASKRLESTNIIEQYFKTYGNQTDSSKPFTLAMIFEPETTVSRQDWFRLFSTTNASCYTRISLSSSNNFIEHNHDVDANLTNLNYTSSVAPILSAPNLLISTFDGELGVHYLHNSARDLDTVLVAPFGHNSPMNDLDRCFIGSASGSAYAKGWLYYFTIIEGVFFGIPELTNILEQEF